VTTYFHWTCYTEFLSSWIFILVGVLLILGFIYFDWFNLIKKLILSLGSFLFKLLLCLWFLDGLFRSRSLNCDVFVLCGISGGVLRIRNLLILHNIAIFRSGVLYSLLLFVVIISRSLIVSGVVLLLLLVGLFIIGAILVVCGRLVLFLILIIIIGILIICLSQVDLFLLLIHLLVCLNMVSFCLSFSSADVSG
jgi:hypothetical protein